MPNKQLGMEKIRQVLRCYSQGHGTKSISSMLSVSRNTVKKYLQVFQRSGLDYEQMLFLPDQELVFRSTDQVLFFLAHDSFHIG